MSVSYSVYLVKNRAGFFLDFEHPTFQGRWRLFTNLDFMEFWTPYLTGRRDWEHGTQGVALCWGLVGLSARAGPQTRLFPHNLHLLNFPGFWTPYPSGALSSLYAGSTTLKVVFSSGCDETVMVPPCKVTICLQMLKRVLLNTITERVGKRDDGGWAVF